MCRYFPGSSRLFCLCLILAIAHPVFAERLPVRVYTTADGLARETIMQIVADSRGYIWFCTAEGLSRYDSYKFTNYGVDQGLPYRAVMTMVETRDGEYWVGTMGQVCRFNPRAVNGQPIFACLPIEETRPQNFVNQLIEDRRGVIWFGAQTGLYQLERSGGSAKIKRVEIGLPADTPEGTVINSLAKDRYGALWASAQSGLYKIESDENHTRFTARRFTVKHGLPSDGVNDFFEDASGQRWVGTAAGLCQLAPASERGESGDQIVKRIFTRADGLNHLFITQIYQTADQRLWLATRGGLHELMIEDESRDWRIRGYDSAQGLSNVSLHSIAEDRHGNLWIGGETSGAIRIVQHGFISWGVADGLGLDRIGAVFEDRNGDLCVVNALNDKIFINRFDGRRFIPIYPQLPATVNYAGWGWGQITFQDREGEWWVTTGHGVYRYPKVRRVDDLAHTKPLAFYHGGNGLTADEIFRIYEDRRGDIWIGTITLGRDVLTRWERSSNKFYRYSQADGLPPASPTAFADDGAGNLWIGFYTGGLARYREGRFEMLKEREGVPAGFIKSLYLDRRNRLWVGAGQGGLARVDDPGARRPRFTTLTTAQGLSSNDIRSITEDNWGRIYIGTGRGVDRINPESGQIRHYTTADGLVISEQSVAYRDQQGALWFGTMQGLSRLIPEPDRPLPPPPVVINGLRIAGTPQPISELGETAFEGPILAPGQNHIQIDYLGLSLLFGERLRYQYKLDGVNQDWNTPTEQRNVNFAELPAGRYRFLVRAVNSEGVSSEQPATITFTILPPIWKRWWFLSLATFVCGAMVWFVIQFRTRRLIEIERMRTRIATDLHDDIGASLARIAILSDAMREGSRSSRARDAGMLTEIADSARKLLDSMGDIVWAIDPRLDNFNHVVFRLRQFAADVLSAQNIAWEFHAPPELEKVKLGPERRRQMYLIFKEAISNIARHADCRTASIKFTCTNRQLIAEIRDDGRGFLHTTSVEAIHRRGNGLANMRSRAAQLGGDLQIESMLGQGTRLCLRMPIER
jgi:ligand-binding sensor domain-containing protein